MKWYKDSKEPGVIQLCNMFRVEIAEFYEDANKYRNYESKATKKNHIHKHRPCGSKAMKKYARYTWEDMRANETA